MDTPNLDLHFENLLYMGRNVLDNTSDYIRKDSLEKRCAYMNICLKKKQARALRLL